jgi:hypothetical protein
MAIDANPRIIGQVGGCFGGFQQEQEHAGENGENKYDRHPPSFRRKENMQKLTGFIHS